MTSSPFSFYSSSAFDIIDHEIPLQTQEHLLELEELHWTSSTIYLRDLNFYKLKRCPLCAVHIVMVLN